MTTNTRYTCSQISNLWLAKKTRANAQGYAAERAKTSARRRWTNLYAAMQAGDELRVRAYAAECGDARKSAWAAVRTAAVPAPKARVASTKGRKTARAQATAVRAATGSDPLAEAARLLGIDASAIAAFMALVAKGPAANKARTR
jgi:hypothetical protein